MVKILTCNAGDLDLICRYRLPDILIIFIIKDSHIDNKKNGFVEIKISVRIVNVLKFILLIV